VVRRDGSSGSPGGHSPTQHSPFETPSRLKSRSLRRYVEAGERFRTEEAWRAYIRGLPPSRPTYLYIEFRLGTARYVVGEGNYAFQASWHLFVERVYTPGSLAISHRWASSTSTPMSHANSCAKQSARQRIDRSRSTEMLRRQRPMSHARGHRLTRMVASRARAERKSSSSTSQQFLATCG
jgi:hypothetical protein